MSVGGTGQPADTLVDVIRRHGICPRDQMCDPPIPGSADCDGCIASDAALDAVAAELETAREERDLFYDRLAATREALEPFVRATDHYNADTANDHTFSTVKGPEILAARAALGEKR